MRIPALRIACVIVTHNRLSLLKDTIAAVQGQSRPPDDIVVVDNNSADGTRQWLRVQDRLDVCLMDENLGGAGGFHHGIDRAMALGADWVWTLDDDCLPASDALERLLYSGVLDKGAGEGGIGFLASRVNWRDGTPHRMNVPGPASDWSDHHPNCPCSVKIRHASFVSVLINRRAVVRVGLPIREFFIYCDDVEYTRRITSAGFSAYYIPSSRVAHLTPANKGVTMRSLSAYPEEHGNRERIVRNLIAVNKYEPFGRFKESARLVYVLVRGMANRAPFRVQWSLLKAGLKGLVWDYRKQIRFPA